MTRSDAGFSLVEMVVATAITLALAASVFAMVHPAHGAFETEPESPTCSSACGSRSTRSRAIWPRPAPAPYIGGAAGPLIQSFAPVLPFRQGYRGRRRPATLRTDTITLIAVPATAAQTTLAADLLPGALTLQAAPGPAVPRAPTCAASRRA